MRNFTEQAGEGVMTMVDTKKNEMSKDEFYTRKLTSKRIDLVEYAKVIQVIKSTFRRGTGIPEDPYVVINQYRDFDGKLLGEENDF